MMSRPQTTGPDQSGHEEGSGTMTADLMNAPHRSTLLEALEILQDLVPEISLKAACAFLYVADNEGLCIGELTPLLRATHPTSSRIVGVLAEPGRQGALVEVRPSLHDGRVKTVHLTERGRAVITRINQTMSDPAPVGKALLAWARLRAPGGAAARHHYHSPDGRI